MEPLSEKQIRASFVNCSKGDAARLRLPADFADLPWGDLDFLGWRDPGAPLRAHVVLPPDAVPGADGPVGIGLRVPEKARTSAVKSSLCRICLTGHASSGVTLLAAPRAGASGRDGNTVGTYVCSDLACSLYVRGRRQPSLRTRHEESLGVEERIDRLRANLLAFVENVLLPSAP
ncbi:MULTISPECIES: FBP domain-containing protein [Streptomyces]|uniref:FBP domain-containing protein n=1 Tax=Streptomyces sudanensis TaxID=436397 RepID=A0ABY4TKS5_9ACTN|nr:MULTISPECIES: FBP domain-containing protein [Streptomyces]MCP9958122.1 FBP domain-containing protein [Streptomyces sudanensis]MCP9987233.1 FBP domain-containing protein [Streptomyces sudanensis]MCQ0001356.1 FBP domain-containing protein [Streptomyces sudanensis]URN18785.1 FBP domain-containing protein [Streptomyces sudanensis]